jgi:hypothetical protein
VVASTWEYRLWPDVFNRVFGETYRPRSQEAQYQEYDDDGQGDNPKFNRGFPESEEHKALKSYVRNHPEALKLGFSAGQAECEVELLSGDRIDVHLLNQNRNYAVEVKSIKSGWNDLQRGIFQCVKYRAVLKAQSEFGPDADINAILVTERNLPSDLAKLARSLRIRCRILRVN